MLIIKNKSIISKSLDLIFMQNNNGFINTSSVEKFSKVIELLKFSILISKLRSSNSEKE